MISVAFSTGLFTSLRPVIAIEYVFLPGPPARHKSRWSAVTGLLGGLATPSSVAPIHSFWAVSLRLAPPPLCVIL